MYNIRVHFDNGDHIDTRINGNIETIVDYYLDHRFPFLADNGKETMATARCVEFLDRPTQKRYPHRCVHRVYSLSEKFMERCEMSSKFRCTFTTPSGSLFPPFDDKTDCAYIPGMFGAL